jgi:hypothetical protein
MKPSSKLPMVLYFRPSKAHTYSFPMPFTLYSGPTAAMSSMTSNSSTKSTERISSAVAGLSIATAGPAGYSSLSGTVEATASVDTASEEVLGTESMLDTPSFVVEGEAAPALEGCASGTVPGAEAEVLAVPVTATGLQPQVIVSKTVVEFGNKVIQQQGKKKKPYVQDIYIRNNTSGQLEVS